jgi:hypothetical protein
MRRIENMTTLSIHRTALDSMARRIASTRIVHAEPRLQAAAATGAAIELQLDEIQRTFGVRWEW